MTNKTSHGPEIHTILGAGQVGRLLATELAGRGKQVRLLRRGSAGEAIENVEWMQGDVTDPAVADAACQGATTVYNCLNPSQYHRWDELLPPLWRAAIAAASRHDARLVVLDNLYPVGRPATVPFDEETPLEPCSKKGALRKTLFEEVMAAHERGEVEVAVGRASDYFGPHTPDAAIFRPRLYERLAAGKSVEVTGDPDQPHSYSFTPDVARGLAVLGTHEAAVGRVWHLPVAAQISTRELIGRIAAQLGVQPSLRVIPTWLMRLLGVVIGPIGAAAEMVYQWETPYLADDSRFRRVFGVGPTPLEEAISICLAGHGLASVDALENDPVAEAANAVLG